MSADLLDAWFGPRQQADIIARLPKRAMSVNVHPDRVVIERGLGTDSSAFYGAEAEQIVEALRQRRWVPLAPGRSKNSAPVRWLA
jgi:hypothetical protein